MSIIPILQRFTHNATGLSRQGFLIFVGGIFLALLFLGVGFFAGSKSTKTALSDNTKAPVILAQAAVNKQFSFPVVDKDGQKVTDISYNITSVDKQNEIIVKGQRAQAVSGRTFFIINIKLVNSSHQTIQLNARDYIRISTGNSHDLLAADIHNDPVIVQPVSTEYTRIGFPINSDENHITLHVGQINGDKTDIPITLTTSGR